MRGDFYRTVYPGLLYTLFVRSPDISLDLITEEKFNNRKIQFEFEGNHRLMAWLNTFKNKSTGNYQSQHYLLKRYIFSICRIQYKMISLGENNWEALSSLFKMKCKKRPYHIDYKSVKNYLEFCCQNSNYFQVHHTPESGKDQKGD